jgi:hypothetical protein
MQTLSEFAANPIGVFFDPERVNVPFLFGQTTDDLHLSIFASQSLPDPLSVIGAPASRA